VVAALPLFLFGPIAVIAYRTPAYVFSGRLIQGLEEAHRAHGEALARGPDWVVGFTAGTLGVLQAAQGRIESAARSLREAVVLVREADVGRQAPVFMAELARCLALLGERTRAEETLRQAEAERLPVHRILDGWFLLPRAWMAAAEGSASAAITEAMDAAESLGSLKLRGQQAMALHDAARIGEPRLASEPLERLAQSCDGELIPTFARHAIALADGDASALDQVSTDFESLGAWLFAAEASAEAARRHRGVGNRGSAAAAASRARSLLGRCEGVRTSVLADLEEALPLTRREREVATLAARGLTNKQIAERLVVSERTVGNHLYSVYAKLGVNGRDDLRRLPELRS
jgi:ATP/maltotriose-dependent transcriptional regulator MalT